MAPRHTIASLILLTGLSSCGTTGFYTQAIRGQWEIQHAARPITEAVADPATPAATRQALAKIPEIREFAITSLGLPDNGSYTTFTDLNRPHAVWVVFAAEEFSTEPKKWWYPFLGSLAYRGYFSEPPARALAERLSAADWETFVAGVDAYSTLGMFRDPVLNTFIHHPDTQVAELIFHELTHQQLYLTGDTAFNEALATAYAQHGVRQWLAATNRPHDLAHYINETRALRAFITLALETRQALATSYTTTAHLPTHTRRAAKNAILADFQHAALQLRHSSPHLSHIDRYFLLPVTNARLASLSTYYSLVPAFETLIAQHPNNPATLFATVQSLAHLPKSQRHLTLQSSLPPPDAHHRGERK